MAENGPTTHVPERRGYGSYEGEATPAPSSLADRDFTTEMPNGKWPADITRDQGRGREGRASRRRSTAATAGSSHARPVPVPTRTLADRMLVRAAETLPEGAHPWCIPAADGHCRWPGWLALMDRYGLAQSTGAKGRSPDDAAAEGVPRTHEDGIRPSRALGGAHPQRGARPGRRLHPLARPRAHQTAARLDESGAIPSEPGNGCVTISKKTPAVTPSRCLHVFSKRSGTIRTNFFSKPCRNQSTGTTKKHWTVKFRRNQQTLVKTL